MHVLFPTELEKFLNIIGEAANRLRARIELNYKTRIDVLGRKFCGLHDTVLPLAGVAKTIFQQLRKRYGRSKRKQQTNDEGVQEGADEAPKINGSPLGRITGVDMRHLLLLLPFLLFDLLFDEVNDHNEKYGTNHSSPANDLIALVLVLLEWYRLYRLSPIMDMYSRVQPAHCAQSTLNIYHHVLTCINQEFCWEDHGISAPFGCPWEEVCVHVRNHVSVQEVWRASVPVQ